MFVDDLFPESREPTRLLQKIVGHIQGGDASVETLTAGSDTITSVPESVRRPRLEWQPYHRALGGSASDADFRRVRSGHLRPRQVDAVAGGQRDHARALISVASASNFRPRRICASSRPRLSLRRSTSMARSETSPPASVSTDSLCGRRRAARCCSRISSPAKNLWFRRRVSSRSLRENLCRWRGRQEAAKVPNQCRRK